MKTLFRETEIVQSINFNQSEILENIIQLFCPAGIELDPTFSKGEFYRRIAKPKYCFDINPIVGVKRADCRKLPLADESIGSIMFDPPFLPHTNKTGEDKMKERFGSYPTDEDLWDFYKDSLIEFYRVLKPKGILVFKCQDFLNHQTQHWAHIRVFELATDIGFYGEDLFIFVNRNRIIRWNQQFHARKTHSYFWVFEKKENN